MRKLLTLAVAAAASLAVAAPAQAAKQCSRQATVKSGTVLNLTTATVADDGTVQVDQTPQRDLNGFSVYHATSAAKVTFDKVTYQFKAGAIFGLSCFGHSAAEGAKYPSVQLMLGTVKAKFRAGKPGAVTSSEGLLDPYASKAMKLTVTRKAKGNPKLDEVIQQGPSALMLGTIKVTKSKSRSYLNVTPYVGPKPGVCRQAKGGTFVSKRVQGRYLKGTAKFRGLAPFSPR